MYNKNIVRRPLKDLTVSATLRKMMDFSEVTGDPRGASRPDLWSKARPSQRAQYFRNLLINWLVGGECKPIIISDADKALHLEFRESLTDLTKVKRRLDPISHKFIQKLRPVYTCTPAFIRSQKTQEIEFLYQTLL